MCSDPDAAWFPTQETCYRTMATRGADRLFARMHEKAQPDRFGMLPTDGSIVWASPVDLDPDNENDFLGLAARQFDGPAGSVAGEDDV